MATQDIALSPAAETSLPLMSRLHELVVTVDHKKLGLMYIGSALFFFVVAGSLASIIRMQLALPNNDLIGPGTFNRLFTMHGTSMVFLFGMPMIAGLMNYLVPLMIGARDMAFPRLNAFGFWMFFFGGVLLYSSYLTAPGLAGAGSAPDVGWFAYAPLTGRAFSRGSSTDYWILGLFVSSVGSIVSAINVIATVVSLRCKGMTLMRMPLFVWLNVRGGSDDHSGAASVVGGTDHAAARSIPRLTLFRYPGGRLGGSMAALLLDLRPPRSVHLDDPGLGLRLGDHPRIFAQTDLRLSHYGRGDSNDRVHRRECVGAPHVRGGYEPNGQQLLRYFDDARGRYRPGSRSSTGWPPCTAARFALSCRCFFASPSSSSS